MSLSKSPVPSQTQGAGLLALQAAESSLIFWPLSHLADSMAPGS